MMANSYGKIIKKLDEFIRKYYKNQLIRGGLYFIALFFLFSLTTVFTEHLAHFGIEVRTIIFYTYLLINAAILYYYIVNPILKILKIGKIISDEQAAQIIGKYFPEVNDKLLNTIQLKKCLDNNHEQHDLIEASIEQKIRLLHPVPFKKAIDVSLNRKYVKYAAVPVFVFILILITAPNIIKEPASRIIHYTAYYEKPGTFSIELLNQKLDVLQQDDFILKARIIGEEVPAEVFIEIGKAVYKMEKESTVSFTYHFKNLQRSTKFRLTAGKYFTQYYILNVLPKPIILNFETELKYPEYTGKRNEVLVNTGDLVIPQGTRVTWNFITRDVNTVIISLPQKNVEIKRGKSNAFKHSRLFMESENYLVTTANEHVVNNDSMLFTVNVILDEYPGISCEEFFDTATVTNVFFSGMIKDDYGFRNLFFKYGISNANDTGRINNKVDTINIDRKRVNQEYFYYFNLSQVKLQPGNIIEYFFEIWDNDGVNGSKSARTQKMVFKVPTLEEIEKKANEENETIKDEIELTIKEARLIQSEIDKLNKDLVDKKTISWPERKRIEDLLERNKKLQQKVEEINQLNIDKNKEELNYKQINEDILEKQKQLEELFEKVMSDEIKEMYKELQKLLDQLDKNKIFEKLEEMKLSTEDIEKQLDRNLELFKQLQFEKELEESLEMLRELRKEQEQINKETESKELSDNELVRKQEEKKEEFNDIEQKLNKLEEINNELENKNKIIDTKIERDEVNRQMQNSINSLNEGKRKKASESQKNATESMDEMIEKLEKMKEQLYTEELGEDAEALREILENLVQLSFDQESLINELQQINKNDPKFVQVIKEQQKIKDGMQMVEDSLFALSKRQMQIQPFVNKEIASINLNLEKAINILLNYQGRNGYDNLKGDAMSRQQYVMTSINNLALLLDEALRNMMQQMQSMKSVKMKNCKNPKTGAKSMQSMKSLQQELNRQIEQLRRDMQEGKNQGKSSSGRSMSEELAKLAAQQEAIRRMLQEYADQLKDEGKAGTGDISKLMKEMEKTEEDLVNKRITNETIKRQQEILTRLLESEKAERQREYEEKRQSEEAKDTDYLNPSKFIEYKRLKQQELELLKKVPPEFNSFYKKKINTYFYNFN